ncbi:hypothetical protein TNCV_650031 [Trichonephila clavipes]|nr:hypothetical protein TNCV_650031 [Trichonephila clavipes]
MGVQRIQLRSAFLHFRTKVQVMVNFSIFMSSLPSCILSSALFLGAAVAQGQGIGSWQICHEFDPSTTKDPPCRAAMHVKSVQSSKCSRWCGVVVRRGGTISGVVLVT